MPNKIVVTGIDTEVGKTVVSGILTEVLGCDYWKPVQSGDLDNSDTMKVQQWVTNDRTYFHQEAYRLTTPASPHFSAKIDGVVIDLKQINLPKTENDLLIEGAGGLMVPLNDEGDFILDLLVKFQPKIVLVSKNYLGSINHTLSAFEVLKSRGLKVDVLIFNGESNDASEEAIESWIQPDSVIRIPHFEGDFNVAFSEFCFQNKELIASVFN